eukprot:CAMPEP_0171384788 /NCGR_PEP_ID=MMETSP0879-20121228/38651_1 /TAXON_ID=67004 /ORGANISM="Thalassiosira weissflogii, Strain CCMP1336" /LENGTH=496 /DNA_ID=CAMNT_0011897071 /DNA_START=40 /DNA_END=1528 /DNA_ORIENTATION=+
MNVMDPKGKSSPGRAARSPKTTWQKEGGRVNPALLILSMCIVIQSFFIIFSQKSAQKSTHIFGLNHIGNHLDGFARDTNKKALQSQTKTKTISVQEYPYARSVEETITNPKRYINDFERHEDAIIATKIHGRNNLITLGKYGTLTLIALHSGKSFLIFVSQTSVQNSLQGSGPENISNHPDGFARDENPLELQSIQSESLAEKRKLDLNPKRYINDFERHEDAIIATKIHGRNNLITLEQSLCLLHYAYNKRVLYNFIIFYTDDLDEKDMIQSRKIVYPANITFVKDSPPLQEVLISLPEERRQNLLTRCLEKNPNITLEDIDWWTYCPNSRINYNWQAEFRAWHIWRNPALAKYKYMLWIDSDGFSTRPWDRDPMAYLINNNLVVFAARFGGGKFGREEEHHRRIFKSFNTTICEAYEDKRVPHVVSKLGGEECFDKKIVNVHGYFYLTNLDFYRSNVVANWVQNWIGDCYLCRNFDDQAAVTVPALILAPQKLW